MGINAKQIGFDNVTMESDRFVCVREGTEEVSQLVVVIDLAEQNSRPLIRQPFTAESAIMNPVDKIIAIKGTLH